MEKDKVFELIQKTLSNVPLFLIGTGGTLPYGIPGMDKLALCLIKELEPKYKVDSEWIRFSNRLSKGMGLEAALTDLNLSDDITDDVINVTWKLISEADINLMKKWIIDGHKSDLGKIVHRFYQTSPQCVNVITTNYDRGIEYSCDLCGMPVNTLFEGEFYKKFSFNNNIPCKQKVNILKVHGSLDWYFEQTGQVVSIPIQKEILSGLKPAIITPGTSKYKRVLQTPFRDILRVADEQIEKAQNYLCIGYGFNDSQIQANIIRGIQSGKAIVVWTKELSDEAIRLIQENSDNYIIVQALKSDILKSEIIIPSGREIIEEQIWTQEELLKII